MDLIRLGQQVDEAKTKGISVLKIMKPSDFDPLRGVVWIEETSVIEAPDGHHVFRDRERVRLLTYWDITHYLHGAGFDNVEAYPDWSTKLERKAKAEQMVFVARKQ